MRIEKLGLSDGLRKKLFQAGILTTADLHTTHPPTGFKGEKPQDLFELAQAMTFYGIVPPWVYFYTPPFKQKDRASLVKDGFAFLSGPYAPKETWMLIKAIAALERSGISWAVATAACGAIELWRKGYIELPDGADDLPPAKTEWPEERVADYDSGLRHTRNLSECAR